MPTQLWRTESELDGINSGKIDIAIKWLCVCVCYFDFAVVSLLYAGIYIAVKVLYKIVTNTSAV